MKRFSILAVAMIALAAPVSASTVSSVSTNASLDPSGNVWRLGTEISRDNRLRTRSRSIYRERNRNQGVRTQDAFTPMYSVGDTRGIGRLFNFGSSSGGRSGTPFFSGASSTGQSQSSGNGNGGTGFGSFDLADLLPGGGGSSNPVASISVVPVPATLPLLVGAFGLLAFMRRRA
jgi:hypothetical protein